MASTAFRLTAALAVIGAMYLARDVLIPIALALLVVLLLNPAAELLERTSRMGRVPSVLTVVAIGLVLLGWTGWLVTRQVSDLAGRLPEYQDRIRAKAASIGEPLGGVLGRAYDLLQDISKPKAGESPAASDRQPDALRVRIVEGPPSAWEVLSTLMTTALRTLGTAVLITIMVVFLLIYQADLRDRIVMLFGVNRINITTQTISEAATSVSRYLLSQSAINGLYGTLIGTALFVLGVPNAVLWGSLAAVLRFIPYLGPWIGMAPPFLLTLAVFDGWSRPVTLLIVVVCLEFVIANVLEPVVYGRRVGLSPVAVIVAAVFWTWLWGNSGLLLAVPLTVCLEVLGRHVPSLHFLSALLAREADVEPHVRFYHRLLGMNLADAAEVVDDLRRRKTVLEIYDEVLIPAISLAERDVQRGELEKSVFEGFLEGVEQSLEDLVADPHPSGSSEGAGRSRILLACVSADGRSNELICRMAAHVFADRSESIDILSSASTTAEKVERVERRQTDAVIVSSAGASGRLSAWHFYKRMRRANPEILLVMGAWGEGEGNGVLGARFRGDGNAATVSTLRDAVRWIEQRAPEIALRRNAASAR